MKAMEEFIDESFFSDTEETHSEQTNVTRQNLFSPLQIGSVSKYVEPVSTLASLESLVDIFNSDPTLQVIPVEENDVVIGVIDRGTVQEETSTAFKRFMGKDASGYVKRVTHILFAHDYIEKNLKKVTEISRKEGILYFLVFDKSNFFGIVSLDDFLERIADLREQDMQKAAEVQQSLLPKLENLAKAPFKLAIWNEMVSKVGGDFYVAQALSSQFYIIGCFDVSGKNYSAALLTVVIGAVFAGMKYILAPDATAEQTTMMLDTWLEAIVPTGSFVTAALCFIDTKNKTVEIQSCGHVPVYIFVPEAASKKRIRIATVMPTLPPLGMGATRDALVDKQTKPENSNDITSRIFSYVPEMHINLYTDGLDDMQNEYGQRFEDQQTKQFFMDFFKLPQKELQNFAKKTVDDWVKDAMQSDDITIMDIRF